MVVAGAALLAVVAGGLWVAQGRSAGGATDTNASAAGATVATTDAAAPAGVISALAVLSFVNTSGNAEDEYFSDGLTDELALGLSMLPGLRLAGRTSSFAFKGKTIQAAEVGRALNVGAIIEGTVRRAGNRIRLTAQLTSTRDGQLLWSDAFERTGADVFAVQDAFKTAIVSALTPRLAGASTGSMNPVAPVGAAARGAARRAHAAEHDRWRALLPERRRRPRQRDLAGRVRPRCGLPDLSRRTGGGRLRHPSLQHHPDALELGPPHPARGLSSGGLAATVCTTGVDRFQD